MDFSGKEFLTREFRVNSYYSDFRGLLSLNSLFSLLQEMAWEHATINGFGFEHLKEQGFFWALSRIKVEISRLPLWTEKFWITTWPSGVDGAFALRDFLVKDNDGNILIGATTSWLVVDIKTRRPHRPDTFKDRMPICDTLRATSTNAQRLVFPDGVAAFEYEVTSRISDIDVNGHINNTKYVEWAVNAFPIDLYNKLTISEISINFLSEGFCGDSNLVRVSKPIDNVFYASIKRISDPKDLANIEVKITV